MPREQLTPEELEAMRGDMSAAALRIYLKEGLEVVTFRALAESLDISHTLPYRYFVNKDALLARMRTDTVRQFERFVLAREDVSAPPLSRVFAVAEAYVDFVRKHPDEYLLIFTMHQPPPDQYPSLLAARQSLFEHAVDVIRECIAAGHLKGEAREIAHEVWVGLHGLLTLHVANQLVHGRNLEQLVRPLLNRILGAQVISVSHSKSQKQSRRKAA